MKKVASKATTKEVAGMFDSIAGKYDFLNHFFSLGIDKLWRRKLVKRLAKLNPIDVLDVATGTGDQAIAIVKAGIPRVTGIDISEQMLAEGRKKVAAKNLTEKITLTYGNCEELQLADGSFDAVSVTFGVRNFEHLEKGLAEMYRVLRPGGQVFILEFSIPKNAIIRGLYRFYFFKVMPFVGRLVSKDKKAYTYLPESVDPFPKRESFLKTLSSLGFVNTYRISLSFGIAELYVGQR